MDILFAILIWFLFMYAAYWCINRFFKDEDVKTPVLMFVGAIGLIVLVGMFTGYVPQPHLELHRF